MEVEEFKEEEQKKKSGFGKGVLIGILGTCFSGILLLLVLVNVLGVSIVPKAAATGTGSILSEEVQSKINELMGYINLYFYDEVEEEKLANGIYAGLVEGLDDRYTQYYTAREYEDLQVTATQNYCGIGAALLQDINSMQVSISHVYAGSPAEEAGLKDGDIVIMVEDIEATSMELSDLVTHIRGEENTSVYIKIYREGESDYLEFNVKRANIDLPTIEYKLLADTIGYIHILDFGAPTVEQFEAAVADLETLGMEAMILDVRDNPGGMITAVNGILDDILPEGTMVYIQDKYGHREDYISDDETQMNYPIAVLMNGNSASASEILAGAIRDYEYGTLIGTKSFGKGVVQTIIPLKDGDAVKLTSAKYFTPNGENIDGTGIEPDIELEYEYTGDVSEEYDEMQDNQILKAIEILK